MLPTPAKGERPLNIAPGRYCPALPSTACCCRASLSVWQDSWLLTWLRGGCHFLGPGFLVLPTNQRLDVSARDEDDEEEGKEEEDGEDTEEDDNSDT